MRDRLEQLLQRADESHETAPLDSWSELAARVRKRHARRRTLRQISAVAGLAFLLAISTVALRPPPSQVAIIPTTTPLQLSVQEQIELHEQTIALLTPPTASTETYFDPTSDVRVQRDRAALVLVYEADAHLKADRRDAALALYRQAIELFPSTHWAEVARERTRQIQM